MAFKAAISDSVMYAVSFPCPTMARTPGILSTSARFRNANRTKT